MDVFRVWPLHIRGGAWVEFIPDGNAVFFYSGNAGILIHSNIGYIRIL